MKSLKKKKQVQHVAFLVDASGSMSGRVAQVREAMAKLMDGLGSEAAKSGIETFVHIYTFGHSLNKHVSEASPREASAYRYVNLHQGTALIDSTIDIIDELAKYEDSKADVSILVYVLTDGQETENLNGAPTLRKVLSGLSDDWTMAILVPDSHCESEAIRFGFPRGNVQVWDVTTREGIEVGTQSLIVATRSYYAARSMGMKGTKCLFQFDSEPSKTAVKSKLDEVSPADYETLLVRKANDGSPIKDFVESWTGKPYRVGSAYYQLTKPEVIQGGKVVAVIEKLTGKMFSGKKARELLKLPGYDVKVAPADFDKFDVFVQSTSTNRKLVADTQLVVFK